MFNEKVEVISPADSLQFRIGYEPQYIIFTVREIVERVSRKLKDFPSRNPASGKIGFDIIIDFQETSLNPKATTLFLEKETRQSIANRDDFFKIWNYFRQLLYVQGWDVKLENWNPSDKGQNGWFHALITFPKSGD